MDERENIVKTPGHGLVNGENCDKEKAATVNSNILIEREIMPPRESFLPRDLLRLP